MELRPRLADRLDHDEPDGTLVGVCIGREGAWQRDRRRLPRTHFLRHEMARFAAQLAGDVVRHILPRLLKFRRELAVTHIEGIV